MKIKLPVPESYTIKSVQHGNTTGALVMGVSVIVLVYAMNVLAYEVDSGNDDEIRRKEKAALRAAFMRPTFLITVVAVLILWTRK